MRIKIKSKILLLSIALLSVVMALILFLVHVTLENTLSTVAKDSSLTNLIAQMTMRSIVIGGVLVSMAILFVFLVCSSFVKNIITINDSLKFLEQGMLPEKLSISSNDEIGDIGERINSIAESLKQTAQYSQEVGKGDFNQVFRPLSEEDLLRNSLLGMTKSLREADTREKERNWVINGIADIGDILRETQSLDVLGESIVKFLVSKINAVQGAFYITGIDDAGKNIIELKSVYAYNRKKYLNQVFKFGEGLVGQAAIEQANILRTEVPDNYFSITTGILGDIKPSCIFICPLISDEKVFGVLEFAGLNVFTPNEIQLIDEAGPIIARTIFNIQVSENTQKHLEESKRMSSELQVQQEELRQNAEEMQATQEELQRSNVQLEEQIEQVKHAQTKMQSLLENASEVITIFDESFVVKYVSPSLESILGYTSSDLIGAHGLINIHEDDADEFKKAFDSILKDPALITNLQFRYKLRNGEWIWLEAIGRNMLSELSVAGMVFNCRDITVKRKAEVEERMRRNMQALSENSPDLITRISVEGRITYVNPVIESYTGHLAEEFINQYLEETAISSEFISNWKSAWTEVLASAEKISTEATCTSAMGKRIMQINAIPEFNDEILESILIISHDITEAKLIEGEIKEKNKSINESINYSKRIQNAIIPDNGILQGAFPESFIMYKPRDVVSGDFPWISVTDDSLCIAAVDCTGHGVPGAMLSLVGYFQLNNIVENHPDLDPGKILDILDEKVNHTLIKSGNSDNIKDGMDVAFCKIDMKKKVLEYAGAHRPLYHLSKGVLQELKGNRWAIGGGTYKNQTLFTNYKIDVKKGESVFFFSDGLPDQFGGPDKRKFGTQQIKELIEGNQKVSMQELSNLFTQAFEDWKGSGKQTDDVLLIGIRF
ncbi:MAG: putative sensor protein [Chitinophagaceae bacterium]|nr:putative sensor protein [Chitinophagaceae bacterium]